jgi:hypothetical protein
MQPSFRPYVLAESIIVLRHGPLPAPRPASFDDLTSGELNCMYVSVRGVVRSADIVSSVMTPTGHLRLLMEGGYIDLEVDSHDQSTLNDLLDAEVEVIGAAGRIFDGKMQQIGAKVKVTTIKDIKVIRHASVSPWSLPVTPMDRIVTGLHVRDLTQRMRVHGDAGAWSHHVLPARRGRCAAKRLQEPVGFNPHQRAAADWRFGRCNRLSRNAQRPVNPELRGGSG